MQRHDPPEARGHKLEESNRELQCRRYDPVILSHQRGENRYRLDRIPPVDSPLKVSEKVEVALKAVAAEDVRREREIVDAHLAVALVLRLVLHGGHELLDFALDEGLGRVDGPS